MDALSADLALQAIIYGRVSGAGGDFVGGIDNDAIDFSQLEAFINSDGTQAHANYFTESLNPGDGAAPSVGKQLKRTPGHSLPDSPPDSSSEHPYSPSETDSAIYKQSLMTPLLNDGLLMVTEPPAEQMLDARMLDYDKSLMHGLSYADGDLEQQQDQQLVYTNLANANRKRKLQHVKSEPAGHVDVPTGQLSPVVTVSAGDEEYAASESCLSDSQYQCIRFQAFQQPAWHVLCDQNLSELPGPHYRVDADKGFNFSNADDAFVCQKKNHFQITCHVQLLGDAQFVKTAEGFQKIASFHLHFYGVKHDCPTQTIRVEQSQSDRSKKPFHPVLVELANAQVTKVTVGRLHFSETTSNNMRKKGKPNPEQRYFQLVVGLHAHTSHGHFAVVAHASQRIIVRASNPGQFESDGEMTTPWQKGQTPESIFHTGRVGVNTDRPDESLVVHGNLKISGHIVQPSDARAKRNITECDGAAQLRNVQRLRVVRFEYEPECAAQLRRAAAFVDTGVIAQEVAAVLPEAVRPAGQLLLPDGSAIDDFLVVNKERIFMENVGAVKELAKVTDHLETRIDQLERLNRRLRTAKPPKMAAAAVELPCSNSFIQLTIVALVLIMAACLAAITALYFVETTRHNQLTQASLQAVQRTLTTRRPSPSTSSTIYAKPGFVWHSVPTPRARHRRPPTRPAPPVLEQRVRVLGRPVECATVDACPVYCCAPSMTSPLLPLDASSREMAPPSFERNNLERPQRRRRRRRKRDDEWPDRDGNTGDDDGDDLHFSVSLHGKQFNASLTDGYLAAESTAYNYTYVLPLSRHLADVRVTLAFHAAHAHIKDVEHCGGAQRLVAACADDVTHAASANENAPTQLVNAQTVLFDVDLSGVMYKVMTYRASLKQNQNKCKLSATKLGIEFTEYNFHVYRQCSDDATA